MTKEVWREPLAMDSTWTGYGLVVECSPDMHEEAVSIPSTTGNKVLKTTALGFRDRESQEVCGREELADCSRW